MRSRFAGVVKREALFVVFLSFATYGLFRLYESPLCKVWISMMLQPDDIALLTPWQCIGGCGAGGSGGGSTGIKWTGQGVGGNVATIEYLPKMNFGRTFLHAIAEPRLSFHFRGNMELGLSMPMGFQTAEVQNDSVLSPQTFNSGGRGDVTCDVKRDVGNQGQYSLRFSLTLPAGTYDESRGPDRSKEILPQSLQMGRGVFCAALGMSYTRDFDKGLAYFEGYFYYPFAVSISGKNEHLNADYQAYRNTTINRKRFYYRFKPYGENDRGGYFPPTLSFDAIYAYRGVPKLVQSFQFFFSAPLGVRWIPSYNPFYYDPIPDPDNRAWDVVLAYGVEFSSDRFPLFLAFGLPIHDRRGTPSVDKYDTASFAKWNGPDFGQLGQEWIIALGFMAGLF